MDVKKNKELSRHTNPEMELKGIFYAGWLHENIGIILKPRRKGGLEDLTEHFILIIDTNVAKPQCIGGSCLASSLKQTTLSSLSFIRLYVSFACLTLIDAHLCNVDSWVSSPAILVNLFMSSLSLLLWSVLWMCEEWMPISASLVCIWTRTSFLF